MSYDVKFLNACNHIVNNVSYDIQLCPKCLGKGYYLDCCFDKKGGAITAQDDIKLQQEILKIIIDNKKGNLFHEEWGSLVTTLIGSKNNEITKNRLKVLVRQAEEYLQRVQLIEFEEHKQLNEKEIISAIESVDVQNISPTGYLVTVRIANEVGDIYEQSVKI